ncbi:MAG: glycosyltransferase family 9 protein [bacterium]|nr:glycosyltransferase family 9 protein [bacterium]
MKILLIQTAFIGDVILSTSLIEKLKLHFPDCSIDFLLRKGNESLLSNNPHLNKVLIFDKNKNKYKNLINLIKNIRSESYDYVINVQRFFTTGLITAFSGGKTKIGFKKNPLSFLYTQSVEHKIENQNESAHEVSRNHNLIKQLTDNSVSKPKLYPSEKDFEKVKSTEEYINIAPTSVWHTKQFPANKWIELINIIPEKYKIYLIGANGDKEICEEIKEKVNVTERIEIKAGELSLLQSAALMKNAKMTFTNDSAPAHLASSMNAPISVVFCSTVPGFGFGPLSDNSFVFETNENLKCRPCGLHGKKQCPENHFKCSDIDVNKMALSLT